MVITLNVVLNSDFFLETNFALFLCLVQCLSISLVVDMPFGKGYLHCVIGLRTRDIEWLPGTPIVLVIMVPYWRE